MDPLDQVQPALDTTYALMRSAGMRGHRVWYAAASALALEGGLPRVVAREVQVPPAPGVWRWEGEERELPLEHFQTVWLRTDPPFDSRYLEATWILDRVDPMRTQVVNHPTGVRGANEKLYAQRFAALGPPTLVTSNRKRLREFVRQYQAVVLKPIDGRGGEGILFAEEGMRGLTAVIETATSGGHRTVAQAYLPAATEGDKRILLLEGSFLGAVLRVHGEGEERNNLHLGGSARKTVLTEEDEKIIAALGPSLREDGLVFVGIDVIGGKLTEVNVTSPTGIQEIEQLEGRDLSGEVIAWCEQHAP